MLCDAIYFADTCDSTWRSTRNQIIIAAHVCSDVAFVVLVVTACFCCLVSKSKLVLFSS